MDNPMQGLPEATLAMLAKLGAGISGSLISLQFLPKDAPWLDRFVALAGGVAAATIVGPALTELTGTSSATLEYSIVFLVGLFGMTVIGELMKSIREVQLPAIIRDAIRKLLRIGGG